MRKLLQIFSVNDPGWGNNHQSDPNRGRDEKDANSSKPEERPRQPQKQDGPPDLDQLWRDFNNRLNGLFKGKGQGGGNNQPPSSKGPAGEGMNPGIGAGVIVLVAVVVWVFSGFFMIQEGQTGVVLQFGKYSYTTRPGINWRMPWPIQSHEVVNLSAIRSVEVGRATVIKASNLKDSSMLTEDENIIDVKFAVQYRLKDASEYLFNNKEPDASVVQAAETAVREIVGKSKMDNVLYENREKLAVDLNLSIQKILDGYKAGIFVTSVTVQNVQPPEQVQAAFDDAVKAGQDRERLKNEGQAYANDIIPKARGAADRLMQEAEGYKAKVVATAEGDATRFKLVQAEYAKAPQVTRERMYIDTMQEIYNNVTKVMVDQRANGSSLLYLPLDKLIQQVTPSTTPVVPSSNTVSNTPANTSTSTSTSPVVNPNPAPSDRRDSASGLRSRER
ncbi:MAG: HflK protein [Pseudomonadota bacterium]|jgi:membrane protease subunit HflK